MLSENLEKTLHRALEAANTRGHQYATIEHLLLALTEDQDAKSLLIACNVDLDRLRDDLLRYIDNDLISLKTEKPVEAKPTSGFQRILQRAAIHVQSRGAGQVTGANIIVALFSERESHAVFFLQEQGMSRLDAVNVISESDVSARKAEAVFSIRTRKDDLFFSLTALPKVLELLKERFPDSELKIGGCQFSKGTARVDIELAASSTKTLKRLQREVSSLTRKLKSALDENKLLKLQLREAQQKYGDICVSVVETSLLPKQKMDAAKGRKQCAVVFMDVVGFSSMPAEERLLKIQTMWKLGELAFDPSDFLTLNTWGDAIAAAVEDPNVAVKAASLLIKSAQSLKLEIRIGIHWGEVEFVYNSIRRQLDFIGDAVNFGARLEPIADIGEILASAELVQSHRFKPELFDLEPVERVLRKRVGAVTAGSAIEAYRVSPREN